MTGSKGLMKQERMNATTQLAINLSQGFVVSPLSRVDSDRDAMSGSILQIDLPDTEPRRIAQSIFLG